MEHDSTSDLKGLRMCHTDMINKGGEIRTLRTKTNLFVEVRKRQAYEHFWWSVSSCSQNWRSENSHTVWAKIT